MSDDRSQSQENPYELLVRREFEEISSFSPMIGQLVQYLSHAPGPVEMGALTRDMLTQAGGVVEVNTDALNLRRGPDMREAVLAQLGLGTRLKMLGQSGEWVFVETADGTQGCVNAIYITPVQGVTDTVQVPREMIRALDHLNKMDIVQIGTGESGEYLTQLTDRGRKMAQYITASSGRG